jgi:UPF0755 protein
MRRWLLILASLPLIGAIGGGFAVTTLNRPPDTFTAPVRFDVAPGEGLKTTLVHLREHGLIRSADFTYLQVRLQGPTILRPGVYKLEPGPPADLLAKMARGDIDSKRVTFPEGSSLRRMAAALDAKQFDGHAYRAAAVVTPERQRLYPFLAALPIGRSLEGYLFPDTYDVAVAGETALVDRQLARFAEVAMPLWDKRPVGWLHNLDQTVTMASIVELEAVRPTERPVIAGVFWRRLQIGMTLGSDPTVEYALQRHQDAKGLSYRDVAIDSPYNTYKYPGLPPTAIANPGQASLEATLHPEATPYLYFVARGDGSHVFSRTLAEHVQAGVKIRQGG